MLVVDEEEEEDDEKFRVDETRACTKDKVPIAAMHPPMTLERFPLKNRLIIGSRKKPFTTVFRKDMADMENPIPASSRPKTSLSMMGEAAWKIAFAMPVKTFVASKSQTAEITFDTLVSKEEEEEEEVGELIFF